MSKKILRPNKEFIELYNKTEEIRISIYTTLSKWTNFNIEYCKKNSSQAMKSLTQEQIKEIDYIFLLSQVMSKKLWANFYYSQFEEIKQYLNIPGLINYNSKKKVIELTDPNTLLFKVRKAIDKFKSDIEKLTKPVSGEGNIKPPLSI